MYMAMYCTVVLSRRREGRQKQAVAGFLSSRVVDGQ